MLYLTQLDYNARLLDLQRSTALSSEERHHAIICLNTNWDEQQARHQALREELKDEYELPSN
jgi:hypothetical protein